MTKPLPPVTTPEFELETLSKAPIAEAILDIFVDGLEEVPMEELKAFWEKEYKAAFPNIRERHNVKLEAQSIISSDTSAPHAAIPGMTTTPLGYLFTSEDGLSVFQIRRDGFSCNRLRPYAGWDPFRDMARNIWEKFQAQFKPKSVNRISLRYVNNIQLPDETASNYFTIGPGIPDDFPNSFEHLLLQFKSQLPELDANVHCTFGFGPLTKGTFLLDLTIESEVVRSEEDMWAKFEAFRHRKNKYFRASITDELLRVLR